MTVTVQPETSVLRVAEMRPWYRSRLGLLSAQLGVGVVIVLIWWMSAHFRWLPPEILPAPLKVFIAFFELAFNPAFWLAFFQTLRAAIVGLGLSIAIGVPVGLVLGMLPPG